MTNAERMLSLWGKMPVHRLSILALRVDPMCHVKTYLYTDRAEYVFSDGSKAVLSSGVLTLELKRRSSQ